MKKFIKDEMNINDIMNPTDLNYALYSGTELVPEGNIIRKEYDGSSILDLAKLNNLDYFNYDYVTLSITEEYDGTRYIYLKQIPMN